MKHPADPADPLSRTESLSAADTSRAADASGSRDPADPLDHARTTRPHAGESVRNSRNLPALVFVGVAVVLFVGCLSAFATDHYQPGLILAGLAAVGFIIGLGWLAIEHLRVRRIEDRWYDEHPGEIRQSPNS